MTEIPAGGVGGLLFRVKVSYGSLQIISLALQQQALSHLDAQMAESL
jgi:hypothetical protein